MTDQEVLEMTEEEFNAHEREFSKAFVPAGFGAETSSEVRMESILKRAKVESVVGKSADFVVESFGRGLMGITDALIGITEKDPKPRRRSF